MSLLEILKRTRELIATPEQWLQNRRADETNNRYCLVGAYCKAAYGTAYPSPTAPRVLESPPGYRDHIDDYNEADVAFGIPNNAHLREIVDGKTRYIPRLFEINDAPETTHERVLTIIDNRIAELERSYAVIRAIDGEPA